MPTYNDLKAQNDDFKKLTEKREAFAREVAKKHYERVMTEFRTLLQDNVEFKQAFAEVLKLGNGFYHFDDFMKDEYNMDVFIFDINTYMSEVPVLSGHYEAADAELGLI